MKFFNELSKGLTAFIQAQKIFFVASAPEDGRVNLSPKGIDTFRCHDAKTVGYLDLTGSGNETAAHIRENKRLTMMFCSFEPNPLILRLYGTGEVVSSADEKWQEISPQYPELPGTRQIILLHIESLQTSCGYGVPNMEYLGDKTRLTDEWAAAGEAEVAEYRQKNNRTTIDGQPTGHYE